MTMVATIEREAPVSVASVRSLQSDSAHDMLITTIVSKKTMYKQLSCVLRVLDTSELANKTEASVG